MRPCKISNILVPLASALALTAPGAAMGGEAQSRPQLPNIVDTIPVTLGSVYLTVNSKTNKIYVLDGINNVVNVMDGRTDKFIKSIPVGVDPYKAVTDVDANKIYVSNDFSASVSVIDGNTDTVIKTINTGYNRGDTLGYNPITHKLYISVYRTAVLVIDTRTGNTINTIANDFPERSAVNKKTNKIYIPNYNDGIIQVVDGNTDKIINTITVGTAAVPDYCFTITPIDCQSPFPSGTNDAVVDERTNKVYVFNLFQGNVVTIDGSIDKVVGSIPAPADWGVFWGAVNEETNTIYGLNINDSSLELIDGRHNKLIGTVTLGPGITPESCLVGDITYSTCTDFGLLPSDFVVNETTGKIYVTTYSSELLVLDTNKDSQFVKN